MCRLKRDIWKAGIALAGMLLLLVLMVWVPAAAADAYERASWLATPVTGTVQTTPTVDATVTALNKEKLAQEVQQLKNQNAPDFFGWLRTNASILLVVGGGLIGLWRWLVERRDAHDKELEDRKAERERRDVEQQRWLEDRQAERDRRDEEQQRWLKDQEAGRERRAEERFQTVVEGLGSEREEAKIGAAITLRTFLRPGYEQFYIQTLDLAVAHLRLRRTSPLSEDPGGIPHSPEDPNTPLPLTTLRRALIVVFKEAFPHAREILLKEESTQFDPQFLDASHIRLDNAFLVRSDLERIWMREAFLKGAHLNGANLNRAYLRRADFRGAWLSQAHLNGADLGWADLSGADLRGADLSGADLSGADLRGAKLSWVRNLEEARSLKGTDLRGVKGLTKERLEACKARGAIIDEAPTTSSSQAPILPPPPSQSNDAQVPSAPPAQLRTPTPDTGGSSAPSSQQGPES